MSTDTASIVDDLTSGDRRALARAISTVERGGPKADAILEAIFPRTGSAYRVGVTGPPGAGKSTLVAALVERLRETDRTVGVVAVDPSSSRTGGAILGDRVRMGDVSMDPGVFIRSMASRGSLGGLARTTGEACDLLDAAGFDLVVVETVGVGQAEVEVAKVADTVCIVLSPESGDGIQTMKAGLLEIGHVFVVNKADRPGSDRLVMALEQMLDLDRRWSGRPPEAGAGSTDDEGHEPGSEAGWRPPILETSADRGDGVDRVLEVLEERRLHLEEGDVDRRRRARIRQRIRLLLEERLWDLVHGPEAAGSGLLDEAVERVDRDETTPYRAAREILAEVRRRLGSGEGESP